MSLTYDPSFWRPTTSLPFSSFSRELHSPFHTFILCISICTIIGSGWSSGLLAAHSYPSIAARSFRCISRYSSSSHAVLFCFIFLIFILLRNILVFSLFAFIYRFHTLIIFLHVVVPVLILFVLVVFLKSFGLPLLHGLRHHVYYPLLVHTAYFPVVLVGWSPFVGLWHLYHLSVMPSMRATFVCRSHLWMSRESQQLQL